MKFTQITAMLLMMGTMVLVFLGMLYLSKREKYKDMEPGKIFIDIVGEYNVTFFVGFMFLFNFASATIAASVTDERSNVFARMISHSSMGFLAWVFSFGIAPTVMVLFKDLRSRPFDITFAWFLALFMLVIGAIVPPLMNCYSIAHALGQAAQLDLWVAKHTPWVTSSDYLLMVQRSGLVRPGVEALSYNPFQGLNNILVMEIFVLICHFATIGYEMFVQFARYRQAIFEKGKVKKEDKEPDEDKGKAADDDAWDEILESIASFIGLDYKAPVFQTVAKEIDRKPKKEQLAFLKEMEVILRDVHKAEDSNDATEKKKLEEKVDREFRELCSKAPKQGGLGIHLPKRKK